MKNVVSVENYYYPWQLGKAIADCGRKGR